MAESENKTAEINEVTELGQTRQGSIHCLSIIGQIEGHQILPEDVKTTKYEHVLPMLAAIEAGLAIAELIAGMSTPTVSLVLGGGHSIGVPLAVAAKRSFIAPSASMTIHPVRINGLVIGAPQTYEYLAGMQERIVSFVTAHSRISRRDYTRLMSDTRKLANDVGTILSGEEAVQCGLIDQIGTLSDALEYLKKAADA